MATTIEGASDFDFLHGDWQVAHRRLSRRLVRDNTWVAFAGWAKVWPILGGLGNVDDNFIDLPEGSYRASTLRFFDPGARQWSIYWVDGRHPRLDPPMIGSFQGNTGIFFGDDVFEDRPIRIRFLWTRGTPDRCRWEQAFSDDQEGSWETNWIMDFSRA
jgi:hypothetical protein